MSQNERETERRAPAAVGRVLLTGATGYLGAHLLAELLVETDATVTCLVRGENEQAASQALLRRLAWYFPERDRSAYQGRVRVLAGDIGAPRFGLDGRTYEELTGGLDTILNAAANVQHVGAASQSFRVNTDGVAALVELARRGSPKSLHHVSTLSVQGEFPGRAPIKVFDESCLEAGQTLRGPYVESKHRAEILLRKAFAENLKGAVYRVGYLGPHAASGRFQHNIHQNNTSRYVRACVRLGVAPYLPDSRVRLTPVDSAATGIVRLLSGGDARGRTYYVSTPHSISVYDVVRVLHAAGYPIRLLALDDFAEKARRLSQDEEALTSMFSMSNEEGRSVPTDSSWSQAELARLGFSYPRPTSAWLGKFVQHAIEVGFLEAPRFWNVGAPIAGLFEDLAPGSQRQ